jgi:hypothetical protein
MYKKITMTKINPKAQDTVDALREWMKTEIKDGPSQRNQLGKFFFSVSATSFGLIISIIKLNSISLDTLLCLAFCFLLLSIIISVFLLKPTFWIIKSTSDLIREHSKQIKKIIILTWIWFLLWLAGFVTSIIKILFENI